MLSKIELEFLKSPESFDADYSRVLRHRVNSKVRELREEMELLQKWDFGVTGDCNGVTEFSTVSRIRKVQIMLLLGKCGAFGGIWTRDHYLTKVTPHRARLRRQTIFSLKQQRY